MARDARTSESDPIEVSWVDASAHGGLGRLGLTIAPGKRGRSSATSGMWERNLDADLDRLKEVHGVDVLVSLMEPLEYDDLQIAGLFEGAERRGVRVLRLPIVDVNVPTAVQSPDVDRLIQEIRDSLAAEETVVIHCRGGLGRSGTIASIVLTTFGRSAEDAIAIVRRARPGAVETSRQEEYVRTAGQRIAARGGIGRDL